jgi:hypothetical protein
MLRVNGKLDAAEHLDLLKIKCFSRDTLVHTATGPRPIGEIEPGEQIWSYHFERGVWGLCEVKERLDNTYSGPVISITGDNTTIEATAYHPFWVIEGRDLQERSKPRELQEHEDEGHLLPGRWVNSHELRAGDCIITRSGTRAIITEIRQRFDDAFPVSNLSIIGHHNYAVGDVGVLVHNKPVCDETIADLRKSRANGASEDEIRDFLRSQKDKDGNRLYDESEIDDAYKKILRPDKKSSLSNRVTEELPPGEMRTPEENAQARNFFERNREAARKWWEEREGREWPSDSTHDEHPRALANGGDPLFIEPGYGGPKAAHMKKGPDGLNDFQRWGKLGGFWKHKRNQ